MPSTPDKLSMNKPFRRRYGRQARRCCTEEVGNRSGRHTVSGYGGATLPADATGERIGRATERADGGKIGPSAVARASGLKAVQ